MRKILLALTLSAAAAIASPASAASLIGDTVTCAPGNAAICSVPSAIVSASTEFSSGFYPIGFDFFDMGLRVFNQSVSGNAFAGNASNFVFNFADTTNAFSSASLGTLSNISGLSAQTVSFNNGILSVALGGLVFASNGSFTVNLATAAGPVTPAVPEPATWAMMILGMAATGFAMRRRIKVSEANFTKKVRATAAS